MQHSEFVSVWRTAASQEVQHVVTWESKDQQIAGSNEIPHVLVIHQIEGRMCWGGQYRIYHVKLLWLWVRVAQTYGGEYL